MAAAFDRQKCVCALLRAARAHVAFMQQRTCAGGRGGGVCSPPLARTLQGRAYLADRGTGVGVGCCTSGGGQTTVQCGVATALSTPPVGALRSRVCVPMCFVCVCCVFVCVRVDCRAAAAARPAGAVAAAPPAPPSAAAGDVARLQSRIADLEAALAAIGGGGESPELAAARRRYARTRAHFACGCAIRQREPTWVATRTQACDARQGAARDPDDHGAQDQGPRRHNRERGPAGAGWCVRAAARGAPPQSHGGSSGSSAYVSLFVCLCVCVCVCVCLSDMPVARAAVDAAAARRVVREVQALQRLVNASIQGTPWRPWRGVCVRAARVSHRAVCRGHSVEELGCGGLESGGHHQRRRWRRVRLFRYIIEHSHIRQVFLTHNRWRGTHMCGISLSWCRPRPIRHATRVECVSESVTHSGGIPARLLRFRSCSFGRSGSAGSSGVCNCAIEPTV
jgi:hypothetical protein